MPTAYIYVRCKSKDDQEKLRSYLDEETTPDFIDDLPEEDQALFGLIEDAPFADKLLMESETELLMYFESDAFEAKENLPQLLSKMKCEAAVYLMESHDDTHYFLLDGDYFAFYYSPEPLEDAVDNEEYNQNLSKEQLEGAKSAYEKGTLDLLRFLGKLN